MKLNVVLVSLAAAYDGFGGQFLQQDAQAVKAAPASIGVPPISVTMQCVINLTIQYFLIYTALAIVRTLNEVYKPVDAKAVNADEPRGWFARPARSTSSQAEAPYASAQESLQAAALTVNYAPMLCVLFIGTRMRALQLTQGDPERYDLPQPWVKFAMHCAAWSVVVQTLMVLFIPLVLGTKPNVDPDGTPKLEGNGTTGAVLTFLRYASMAAMYGGFTAVCAGCLAMEAPSGTTPPISPAVACTMNLCVQFFFVYLGIALIQTYHLFQPAGPTSEKLAGVLQMATNTVNFAPMLAILFIGARMRALQLDPVDGNPQEWAQTAFYVCSYALLGQLVMVIVVPLLLNGTCKRGTTEGDVTFEFENSTMYVIGSIVRYAALFALYIGFSVVIYSICTIESKSGPTIPVSPTMQCVINLTVQFFFVYLMLWMLVTTKQFVSFGADFLDVAIPTFDAARQTVQFCPMLAILFVGTRMRALQITDNKGAPQGWCQQAMFLSTYALLIQVFMVVLLPLFTRAAPKIDADGNLVQPEGGHPALLWTCVVMRYVAFVFLYGGVTAVICALFLMTKETANGSGSLVPGVDVPAPPPPPISSF